MTPVKSAFYQEPTDTHILYMTDPKKVSEKQLYMAWPHQANIRPWKSGVTRTHPANKNYVRNIDYLVRSNVLCCSCQNVIQNKTLNERNNFL